MGWVSSTPFSKGACLLQRPGSQDKGLSIPFSGEACLPPSLHPLIPFTRLSIHQFIRSSVHPSVRPSIPPSIHGGRRWRRVWQSPNDGQMDGRTAKEGWIDGGMDGLTDGGPARRTAGMRYRKERG